MLARCFCTIGLVDIIEVYLLRDRVFTKNFTLEGSLRITSMELSVAGIAI